MFGYLRPVKEELKVREYELYKSVYCGLCKHLGKDYGLFSRFTLSYDCTMLAMLALSVKGEKSCVSKGRCVFNPTKKCLYCSGSADSFRLAGAVSVIMTYYKLYDTITDGGLMKRAAARFLRVLMKRSHRKAKRAYPELEEQVRQMVERQQQAEAADSGIDDAAASTAELISWLCRGLAGEDEKQQFVLEKFGYFLGRWIYLIDAADDFEDDLRRHTYNPFHRYRKETPEQTMLYCNEVLNMTASQLLLAFDLLELSGYEEILDNVVRHGLSFQQRYCLFEKKHGKQCRRKKKDKDYYPFLSDGFH